MNYREQLRNRLGIKESFIQDEPEDDFVDTEEYTEEEIEEDGPISSLSDRLAMRFYMDEDDEIEPEEGPEQPDEVDAGTMEDPMAGGEAEDEDDITGDPDDMEGDMGNGVGMAITPEQKKMVRKSVARKEREGSSPSPDTKSSLPFQCVCRINTSRR